MSDTGGLEVRDLEVRFAQSHGQAVAAARVAALDVPLGCLLGLAGPSGSGKTTLLHALAGLLRPQSGQVRWDGLDLAGLPEAARDRWRRQALGFIFQDFHLIPELSARDNVRLPGWFGGARRDPAAADRLLARMGINDPRRRAGVMSRGEQQRVAIARAMLGRPRVVLADEPTASLDAATGAEIADLLVASVRERGATLILVSHDPAILARMDVVRHMEKGVLA
jgi:putative ABC transport system ATP-binding protein